MTFYGLKKKLEIKPNEKKIYTKELVVGPCFRHVKKVCLQITLEKKTGYDLRKKCTTCSLKQEPFGLNRMQKKKYSMPPFPRM